MRKVPLYPELNDDQLSNSEMIREGLLDKLYEGGANRKNAEKESPKVMRELSYKSN